MNNSKRLKRSNEKMVAGVCTGIANYFEIDPTLVRIGFVAFAFAGGSAILAFLIMWIVVPKETII